MENKLDKIEKLKSMFTSFVSKFGTEIKTKFNDMKLMDGTTVVRFPNDMIAKGDMVTVITEQGELPLPDNTPENPIYTLEDGSTFTVISGMVDMYTEAETEAEDTTEGGVEEPTSDAVKPAIMETKQTANDKAPKRVIKSQVEEHVFNEFKKGVEEMFLSMTTKIATLENENKTLVEKFEAQNEISKQLVETVDFIANEPATTSVEKQKTVKKSIEEMTSLERYRYFKSLEK